MLFQTSAVDRSRLIAVGVLFLTVALLACFVPAWRASRIDPMSALRQEWRRSQPILRSSRLMLTV